MRLAIISLVFAMVFPVFASETKPPKQEYDDILMESLILDANLSNLQRQAETLMRAQMGQAPAGPHIYSTDTLWQNLEDLINGSSELIASIKKMIETSDVQIGAVGDKLIAAIDSVQSNINKTTTALLLLSEDLKEQIGNVVPGVTIALQDLVNQINSSVNNVSTEIESAIKLLAEAGVQQVNIIGNGMNSILLTVKDSATGVTTSVTTTIDSFREDMHAMLGDVDIRFDQILAAMKDSGITQLVTDLDNGIVEILRTVNDGVRTFSEVVTSKVDGIGDKVIEIMEEVRATMAAVTSIVQQVDETLRETKASIVSLTNDTVGYVRDIELEVVPRIYVGENDSDFNASGGATFLFKNFIKNDSRHFLEAGFEESNYDMNWSALYGFRPTKYVAFRGGIMHDSLGVGVSFGNEYNPIVDRATGLELDGSDFVWGVGADYYGVDDGDSLDLKFQVGQRSGVRGFGELRDVIHSGARNWRVGVGASLNF